VDEVPEDRSARVAFLERWATEQQRQLYADEIARVVTRARERAERMDSFGGVAVIPVVITKPSYLPSDRAAVFAELVVGLREYKWADTIVSECDDPRYIAPNAIELARRHRPDASWLLYMEDDVVLGPDFGWLPEMLREADELFRHTGLVSFFSLWFDEPGWSIHPIEQFGSLLCVAIRNTDHLVGFRAFIDYVVTQSADKQWMTQSDQAVRTFLGSKYDAHAVWCPSLVQHAEVTPVYTKYQTVGPPKRISTSYEQAYG
jgi:hypothetical protein